MCYARRQRSSWARIKLSKKLYSISKVALAHSIVFQSYFFLASFTFLSSQCVLTRFLTHLYTSRSLSRSRLVSCYFEILLFNFQGSMLVSESLLFRDARLVYHTLFRLSTLFLKFFCFFSSFFQNWQNDESAPAFCPSFSGFCHPFLPFSSCFLRFFKQTVLQRLSFS